MTSNRQIAKNALYMYLRMFLIMFVGLYTTRVVLRVLGIENYGIYNVVGGFVVLFTFISNSLSTATQRHLSYELGRKNGNISKVYSACFNVHFCAALLVIVFAETIGLWFVNYKLNFPPDRMVAVNWIFHFSVINCFLGIIRVPDNAAVIAYERMSFFAYMGIVEAILKLLIVYLLIEVKIDKLILYSGLLVMVTSIVNCVYAYFRRSYLKDIKYRFTNGGNIYKKLISFSGWTIFGSLANVGRSQGLNIIINIFYGVSLNAAVGIANQLNGQIMNLVNGFQQAINPQLTKLEASGNRDLQSILISRSARFSYLLMFVCCYPLLVNLAYVLKLWLGGYPEHTVEICRLIVVGALIEALSGPLWVTLYAIGKIEIYQITVSSILLLILPISYIGGICGMTPETMFIICNMLLVVNLFVRLELLRRYIKFNIINFMTKVFAKICLISLTALLPLFVIPKEYYLAYKLPHFLFVSVISFGYVLILSWVIGLDRHEKNKIQKYIIRKYADRS